MVRDRCPACATPLPPAARFCPGCGVPVSIAPPPERAPRHVPWLAMLAAAALVILAVVFVAQRDGARSIATTATPAPEPTRIVRAPPRPTPAPAPVVVPTPEPPRDLILPARAIDAAMERQGSGRDMRLDGPLSVRGIVVDSDGEGTIALEGRDADAPVLAQLPEDQREAAYLLEPGTAVRLRCRAARMIAGTTVLEACRL